MPEPGPRAAVLGQLDLIHDPCSVASGVPMGLTEMGLVAHVDIAPDGRVHIDLRLTSPFCHMIPFMQSEAVRLVGALPGVTSVTVAGDQGLDWSPDMIAPEAQERRRLRLEGVRSRTELTLSPTNPARGSD
jgi:metal-sulfur cluster biosynthetic enzyme